MDKKAVQIGLLFLLILMLSNINSYSQKLYAEKLYWTPKSKAINELYKSMQDFVNDSTPVFEKQNKLSFFEMNFSDWLTKVLKKPKIDKQLTFQKRIKQNEMKNYLDSSFVILHDSVVCLGFNNKNQIEDWGRNLYFYSFIQNPEILSTEFCIKGNDFFILIVDSCSGLPCLSFYIFKEENDIWELQTTSQARLKEKLNVRIDNEKERIIFETPSYQIGELTFKTLL